MPVLSKKNAPAVHTCSQRPSHNLNVTKNDKVDYVEFNMFLKDFWTILASKLCCEMAVDKSRNMAHPGTFRNTPEHPGTSNNYDNYEKQMCKLKFWACSHDHLKRSEWSRRSRNMFLFASRTTLL